MEDPAIISSKLVDKTMNEPSAESMEATAPDDPLDDEVAIRRYVFLRSLNANRKYHKSLIVSQIENLDFGPNSIESHITSLAARSPKRVFLILDQAAASKFIGNREELLWCVAFCLKRMQNEEISKDLRENFMKFVVTQRDVLVFANFCQYWSKKLNPKSETVEDKKKNLGEGLAFGRGLKKCLQLWYDSHSADDLVNILYSTQAVNGIKHVDIIHLIRLYGGGKRKADDKGLKTKRMKTDLPDAEKKLIVESTYWNTKKFQQMEAENKNVWIAGHKMKKVLYYRDIKQAQNGEALGRKLSKSSQEFKLDLSNLPSFGAKSEQIPKLLEGLSVKDTMDAIVCLHRNKAIKRTDLLKVLKKNLSKTNKAIADAKLNPVKVLAAKQMLELRYNSIYKGKEVAPDFKHAHDALLEKLKDVLNKSLSDQPKTGCRYYVTLDLRKFSQRKTHVFGAKEIPCVELQIVIALCLKRCEAKVTLKAFTDHRSMLKDVPWTSATTFDEAYSWYAKGPATVVRTKEHFEFPMTKAKEDKVEVDVFITFVSSIARTAGKAAKPPLEALNDYRSSMKLDRARVIVVNLTRQKPDFASKNSENGILEIVGFNEDGMNTISSYAEGIFK